ncbi:hypothetical protein [Azospirillum sp. SYSU D00513]|uniref:hypothetical protein n=1 Tax=Azospirillum sp. SYSU D00513 TaxID=2812561 RepID=UPI001A966FDB|nr:hypothetical protein [Azospirillum sp. SYSU D00513]
MAALSLPSEIPTPLADMAVLAAKLSAGFVIFDAKDILRYASERQRQIYSFCDFNQPLTFDDILLQTAQNSRPRGNPALADVRQHLSVAKLQRLEARLEFTRLFPVEMVCSHVRLGNGWNAQIRVEKGRSGVDLDHYFSEAAPAASLVEVIRQRENARQKAAALDCIAIGVAVVSRDCVVRHKNAAMDDMLLKGDGLRLRSGRIISSPYDDDDINLRRLVAAAASGALPVPQVAICLRRPNGGEPLVVSVSQNLAADGMAVVVVAPPKFDEETLASVLERDFGLTPAEAAHAAAISDGASSHEVTTAQGKSAATGRSQLASITRKLSRKQISANSQSRLTRFAMVVAAITGAARSRSS